jgi:transposase
MPPLMNFSRRNQSLREKSDKPAGGQQDYEGHTLLLSSSPDILVELKPDYCNCCGSDLREIEAVTNG